MLQKLRKIIEERKKKKSSFRAEAPPAAAKEKPDRIPMPDEKKETKEIEKRNKIPKRN